MKLDEKNDKTNYVGLYYPFIHFRNENWLKLAVLYWDKMSRIVPAGFELHDGEIVNRLKGEIDFIGEVHPAFETFAVAEKFLPLLKQHSGQLRSRYGVGQVDDWPKNPLNRFGSGRTIHVEPMDGRFAYVYHSKMAPELIQAFRETRLAIVPKQQQPYNPGWIGMHPRLAEIYMAALAAEISDYAFLRPVADSSINHLSVCGCTVERLAQALLDDPKIHFVENEAIRDYEVEEQMANVAIQTIIPAGIDKVPLDRIINFRRQYNEERLVLQAYIHDSLSQMEWLQEVRNPDALKLHLENQYERDLKPKTEKLRNRLASLGINTVLSAMNMRIRLPKAIKLPESISGVGKATAVGAALVSSPILAAVGAVAFSLIPVIKNAQKVARMEVNKSPVAYLLFADENLNPETMVEQITRSARKFCFNV